MVVEASVDVPEIVNVPATVSLPRILEVEAVSSLMPAVFVAVNDPI